MQPRAVRADRLALRAKFCLEFAVGLEGAAIVCDKTSGFRLVRRRDSSLFGEVPTCYQSLQLRPASLEEVPYDGVWLATQVKLPIFQYA